MNTINTPLKALPGEGKRAQKERFKSALEVVAPRMDRFYSRATLRRFPDRSPSHIRNIKQVGIIDWPVLEYWAQEYLAAEA